MSGKIDHHVVEILIEAADASDEEIVQIVNRVGLQPTLEVIFGELFLDIDTALGVEEEAPLIVQYDLTVGPIVVTHLVTFRDGSLEVQPGDWRSGAKAEALAAQAHLWLRHTLLEFTGLYRAVLGAAAAGEDGPSFISRALVSATRVDWGDWPAIFARRGRECRDLKELAVRFGADKWGVHWYTDRYEQYFGGLRERRLKILEIGVGGYGDPKQGGPSLQMWKRYFPRGLVYGIDVADKSALEAQRIRTFQGDQADLGFLESIMKEIGPVDIIVDDGSHVCQDQIASFQALFPHLQPGGFYLIEDLQTSYWPGFGGSSSDLSGSQSAIGFLKSLIDGLNYEEFVPQEDRTPSYTDRNIVAIHFFHSLAIIEKGENAEGSSGAYLPERIKMAGYPVDQSEIRPDQW